MFVAPRCAAVAEACANGGNLALARSLFDHTVKTRPFEDRCQAFLHAAMMEAYVDKGNAHAAVTSHSVCDLHEADIVLFSMRYCIVVCVLFLHDTGLFNEFDVSGAHWVAVAHFVATLRICCTNHPCVLLVVLYVLHRLSLLI